jgi:acyl-CoA synthetase (AMP-forming)/AMP-acid ligase II
MHAIRDKIRATLRDGGDAPAIQFKGHWTRWSDLAAITNGLNAACDALDLAPGDQVACLLRNSPAHAAMMLGTVAAHRCLVPVNALQPDLKLVEEIQRLRPKLIVATPEDWDRSGVEEAARAVGAAGLEIHLAGRPAVTLRPGRERPGSGMHPDPSPDVAILMLTSGTTGAPKRVPLRIEVIGRQLMDNARTGPSTPDATATEAPAATPVIFSSFVHIGGVWGVFSLALNGCRICLLERFQVREWRDAIVAHRPAMSGAPPTALRMILDADIPRADLASLKYMTSGTAPLDPKIVDRFLERYDLPILQNYGATEFAGGVAGWSLPTFRKYWATHRGATGRLHRSIEGRVIDAATGEVLAEGEEGVLELRGFAIGGGEDWVRTTDRAMIDAQRFLWIRGRIDNAINRGGFKIQPEDIARVLESHPSVREASVVGVPDSRLGETPCAAVVLKAGAPCPGEDELRQWARARLLPYQTPSIVRIVDEFPRTPSLKVSVPAMRELFLAPEQADVAEACASSGKVKQ